ncbi:bZIP transcription factor 16 [Zea mays]|uniref:BZIP transcription factor 16 n=1 Tax=Zea mays TaxID=4577 RepID=A0A317YIB5_MAIZE|nr:bZIP transcription factor 16 [Zea mays]
MGKGDVATRSKSQKSPAIQNEQSTPANPPTAYPDWSQFQAYYNAAGTAPVTPPFFHPSVAPSHQGHPYMWGPQMMSPYGTPPPYAAMYAQGTPYQQAPMPPGSHPYSPYPMQLPNGTVQTPTSGAGGTATDKSNKNKRKASLKRSKGSLGSLDVVAVKNNKSPAKPSTSSSNEGSSQSICSMQIECVRGAIWNTLQLVLSVYMGSRVKDNSEQGQGNDARSKCTQSSVVEPTQPSSGSVVLNPMMPFWPVPPPMAGPATTLNMGVDYWGTPASVPMHGKVIAAPTSAPSSNSRDIVLSDPTIQDGRELKRQKRKQSNRESARRSRLRKQAEWEEVANRADLLKQENSSLKEELKQLQEKCDGLTSENTSLHVLADVDATKLQRHIQQPTSMAGAWHKRPCRLRCGLLQRVAEQSSSGPFSGGAGHFGRGVFGNGCAQWAELVMGAVLGGTRLTLEGDEVSARLGAVLGHGQRFSTMLGVSKRGKMGNGWRYRMGRGTPPIIGTEDKGEEGLMVGPNLSLSSVVAKTTETSIKGVRGGQICLVYTIEWPKEKLKALEDEKSNGNWYKD